MKILGNVLIALFLSCSVMTLDAQKKVVTGIDIPSSKTQFTMKYNPQGKLSELIYQKGKLQFGTGYKIIYPRQNTILCETGGIDFQKDKFNRYFSYEVKLKSNPDEFSVVWKSYLDDDDKESVYEVSKEGVIEGKSKLISSKWNNNSLSEINWDGDVYEFKYSDRPYSVSQSDSWNWLLFAIEYILPNDYLQYWYVGKSFNPFAYYPSEIIYRAGGEKEKYLFEYLFMPNGNITIDYLCVKNGETVYHSYMNVNFNTL